MLARVRTLVTTALIATTLGSCSYEYDIKAVPKKGRVVFTIDSSDLFGSRTPYVNDILMERIDTPTKLVWKLETQESNGPEIHELPYGEAPSKMKTTVVPTPLAIGQLYRVTFLTIDGGGEDQFVISESGEVLNIGR